MKKTAPPDARVLQIGEYRIIDLRDAGEIVIEAQARDRMGKPKWDEFPSRIMNRPHVRAVPESLWFQIVRKLIARSEDSLFPETARAAAPEKRANGAIPAARLPRTVRAGG